MRNKDREFRKKKKHVTVHRHSLITQKIFYRQITHKSEMSIDPFCILKFYYTHLLSSHVVITGYT